MRRTTAFLNPFGSILRYFMWTQNTPILLHKMAFQWFCVPYLYAQAFWKKFEEMVILHYFPWNLNDIIWKHTFETPNIFNKPYFYTIYQTRPRATRLKKMDLEPKSLEDSKVHSRQVEDKKDIALAEMKHFLPEADTPFLRVLLTC